MLAGGAAEDNAEERRQLVHAREGGRRCDLHIPLGEAGVRPDAHLDTHTLIEWTLAQTDYNPWASSGPRGDVSHKRSKDRLADAEKAFAWVTGQSHIGQGEVAEGAAGRQLWQELQGVAKELQGAQVRQRAQVDDGRRQPIGLQRELSQLGAAPDLACVGAARTQGPQALSRHAELAVGADAPMHADQPPGQEVVHPQMTGRSLVHCSHAVDQRSISW